MLSHYSCNLQFFYYEKFLIIFVFPLLNFNSWSMGFSFLYLFIGALFILVKGVQCHVSGVLQVHVFTEHLHFCTLHVHKLFLFPHNVLSYNGTLLWKF